MFLKFLSFIFIICFFGFIMTYTGIKSGIPLQLIWVALVTFISLMGGIGIILIELDNIKNKLEKK